MKFVTRFDVGGTEKQVVGLAREFERGELDLRFACLHIGGSMVEPETLSRFAITQYPVSSFLGLRAVRQLLKLARDLRRNGIDVAHSYNFYANVFMVPAARLAHSACVIASVRDMGIYLTPLQKRVHRWAYGLADAVVVNAHAIKAQLVAEGCDARKISVIRNGIDLRLYGRDKLAPALDDELGLPAGARVIVMLSRLNPQKGVNVLLEAARQVLEKHADAWFVIVGDIVLSSQDLAARSRASYARELEERARELGISGRVLFTGLRGDVPSILARSSISVLPSFSEGLSNAVLESMASGVPVVATRVGGTPELIEHRRTGWLVEPGDAGALAEALCLLLDDPDLAMRLGQAARARVEKEFSFERMYLETESLYRRILAEKGRSGTGAITPAGFEPGRFQSREFGRMAPVATAGVAIGAAPFPEWEVRRIDDTQEFLRLRQDWDALLSRSDERCLFLTWEWLYTWWKHLGGGRRLFLLTVRRAGRLVGIAPLAMSARRMGPLRTLRAAEFLGSGTVGSDYLDIIVDRECTNGVIGELAGFLRAWGVGLVLTGVPAYGSNAARLADHLAATDWSVILRSAGVCPYIPVNGRDWSTYYESLGRGHRAFRRRQERRAHREHRVSFTIATTEAQQRAAFREFVRLHGLRWSGPQRSQALTSPEIVDFHEDFCRLAFQRGWLRASTLFFDDAAVASTYGISYADRFYYYQSGFDPQFGRNSVGGMCLERTLAAAWEEAVSEFDFLHGTEGYKWQWARDQRRLVRLALYPPTLAGRVGKRMALARLAASRSRSRVPSPREASGMETAYVLQPETAKGGTRRWIKYAAARALKGAGIAAAYGGHAPSAALPLVLGYHRAVVDFAGASGNAYPPMLISVKRLEEHLDWIGRRYEFVSLDELDVHGPNKAGRGKPQAAVTFDDGYADVYHHAFPLLRRKGIPFSVFVVSDFVGKRGMLAHDELYYLLSRALGTAALGLPYLQEALRKAGYAGVLEPRVRYSSDDLAWIMRRLFTALPSDGLRALLDALRERVGIRDAVIQEMSCMDWDMLRALRTGGVVVGCHSNSHARLTNEGSEVVLEETRTARRRLEAGLGAPVRDFAYPDGEFNDQVVAAVRDAGFDRAYIACMHSDRACPQMTIPRRLLWEESSLAPSGEFAPATLQCMVDGVFDGFAKCRGEHYPLPRRSAKA